MFGNEQNQKQTVAQYNYKNLRLGRAQLYILFILVVIFISAPDLVYAHPANQATEPRLSPETPNSRSNQQTPAGIVIGDIDADGDLDMVSSDPTSIEIFLTDNTSQPAYTPIRIEFEDPAQVISQTVVRRTLLGDMDGNGLLDIISADGKDIALFFNSDDLGFSDEPDRTLTISNTLHHHYDIAIGDIDGDSQYEIVAAISNEIILFDDILNVSQTQTVSIQVANHPNANSIQIELGNMDQRDGLDLIYFSDIRHDIYLNNNGTFASPVSISDLPTNLTNVANLLIGDLDHKNGLDMISIEETIDNERQYVIYYSDDIANANTISFTRTAFYTLTDSTTTLGDQLLALGDITNDGWLDILLAAPQNNAKHRYWRNRSGDFVDTPTEIETRPIPVCCITTADMNQDGFLDFVARHLSVNYIYSNAPIYLFNESSINNQSSGLECDNLNERTASLALDPYECQQLSTFNPDMHSQFIAILEEAIPASSDVIETHTNIIETIIKPISRFGITNFFALPWNNLTFVTDRLLDQIPHNTWDRMATTNHTVQPTISKILNSVTIGDLNQDGFSDFVLAKHSIETQLVHTTTLDIYLNNTVDGFNKSQLLDRYQGYNFIRDIVIQDMNNDGFPDIIIGNNNRQNKLYINQGSGTNYQEYIFGRGLEYTNKVAVADLNSDGWLDIATTNNTETFVYINMGNGTTYHRTVLNSTVSPIDDSSQQALWIADIDGNGNLDIQSELREIQFTNHLNIPSAFTNNPSYVTTVLPTQTQQTMLFDSQLITIEYRLHDNESDPVRAIRACYSADGGGNWQIAMNANHPITDTASIVTPSKGCPYSPQLEATGKLSQITSPTGTLHTFVWDTFASNLFGQSDNVVFRIEVFSGFYPSKNSTPGVYQRVSASSVSQRFQVRGTQIQVVNEDGSPVSGAKVYRIPTGQNSVGQLISNGSGSTVFQTNDQGYLQGRGAIRIGDQLLALAPQPLPITTTMQWAAGLTGTIHLYYTSGTVTETGVTTWISNTESVTVTESGVQVLQVSSKNPLLLFDLRVALEWDASTDPNEVYLSQLRADLRKAAEFLYDFTNGQATLGTITVTQNAEDWLFADVVIRASNRLRPLAVQGGVVITATPDISSTPKITYTPGQVIMGATWNRYGTAGQNLGYDWPLALAHELSHYLFFLDDTYLGKTKQGLLIAVDSCQGSVMGDMYNPSGENTEFIADQEAWNKNCDKTLANELERTEWETIRQRYPMLTDTLALTGPSRMPFDFTQINVLTPTAPTATLADPILFLDYHEPSKVSSGATRAYLIRENQLLFDLGTPVGGQNRLLARGAREGDRLCAVDPQQKAAGCKLISRTDERLDLHANPNWQPNIEIHPVNTSTVNIQVQMIGYTTSGQLTMRLFPELFHATPPIPLIKQDDIYSATVALTYTLNTSEVVSLPIVGGHIELWDDGSPAGELTAAHTIVAFYIAGNWGSGPYIRAGGPYIRAGGPYIRAGGPYIRAGGPYIRAGGVSYRTGYAPVSSTDGSFIQVMTDTHALKEGDLYTIQDVAVYPALPTNTVPVGQVYQVITSRSVKTLTGSISFQYLGSDALALGLVEADEQALQIYHCPDRERVCKALDTIINIKYNLASAASQGSGFYALLARTRKPQLKLNGVYTIPVEASGNVSIIVRGQNFDTDTKLLVKDCTGVSHIISATLVSGSVIGADLPKYSAGRYTVYVLKDNYVSEEFAHLHIGDATKDECNP